MTSSVLSASCQLSSSIATIVNTMSTDAHEEHGEALADEVLQRLDVGGHARHEETGARAVEEPHRQIHDVVEHALAEVEEERLTDARDAEDRGASEDVRTERGERRTAARPW